MTIDVINHIVFLMLKITLVVIPVVWAIERSRNTSASNLHRIVLISFIALLAIPLASFLLPKISVPVLHKPYTQALQWPWQSSVLSVHILTLFFAVYCVGVLYKLISFIVAARYLKTVEAESQACVAQEIIAAVQSAKLKFAVNKPIRCILDKSIAVPMTWGILKPVVALPTSALQWCPKKVERVVLHEVAHIKRNDAIATKIIALIDAFLWCIPTKALLLKKIHWFRELACDDMVIAAGVNRSDYAQDLMDFAHHKYNVFDQAVALFDMSEHYNRIYTVLDTARIGHSDIAQWRLAGAVIVALFMFVGVLSLEPKKFTYQTRISIVPAPAAEEAIVEQQIDDLYTIITAPNKPVLNDDNPVLILEKAAVFKPIAIEVEPPKIVWEQSTNLKALNVESPAEIIRFVTPEYPKRELNKGVEGTVEIAFDILTDGHVDNIRIIKPHAKNAFNKAVVYAAQQFVYHPKIVGGKPVVTKDVKEVFQFQIEDAN